MPRKMPLEALLARSGMSAELRRDVRRYANADKRRWSLPCGIRTLDGEVKAKLDADYQLIIVDFAAAAAARAARCAAAERREQEREEEQRRINEAMPPPAESTRTALLPPAAVEFPASGRASAKRRAPQPRTPRR